jgi:hypothetical protein
MLVLKSWEFCLIFTYDLLDFFFGRNLFLSSCLNVMIGDWRDYWFDYRRDKHGVMLVWRRTFRSWRVDATTFADRHENRRLGVTAAHQRKKEFDTAWPGGGVVWTVVGACVTWRSTRASCQNGIVPSAVARRGAEEPCLAKSASFLRWSACCCASASGQSSSFPTFRLPSGLCGSQFSFRFVDFDSRDLELWIQRCELF